MAFANPLKDTSLEKFYQDLFEMYGGAGWQSVMEDLTKLREIYDTVGGVETAEDLWFRKGQLDLIDQLLSHQARHEQAYADQIDDEQGEGAADKPTGGKAKLVELEDIV